MTLSPQTIDALETALDRSLTPDIPGAAIAITSPGGSWFGASGTANIAAQTPLQPNDRFEIGSITKTFIAITVLQLVESGKLSLEDTVTRWLPTSVTDGIRNADQITIRQLLQHTSGIPDYTEPLFQQAAGDPFVLFNNWTSEQLVGLVRDRPSEFAPGTNWSYSNTNFALAGLIVESATGNSLAKEIRDRILTPLDLKDTFFATEEEVPGGYIKGYWDFDRNGSLDDITLTDLSWAGSAGAMVSTTADLATFTAGLFKGRLLQPESLAQMLDAIPVESPNYSSYGLGIGTIESPNRFWWIHRGQTLGFRSNLWYAPAEDITYVELINGRSSTNLAGAVLPVFRSGIAGSQVLNYNEAIGGDISNNPDRPLGLSLVAQDNVVRAATGAGDSEYFTVRVPTGFQLNAMELSSYASSSQIVDPQNMTIAMQSGSTFTASATQPTVGSLLGYGTFGRADLTTDILDDLGKGQGAIGFQAPLPSGNYTFLVQQPGAEVNYTFNFYISPVVANPGNGSNPGGNPGTSNPGGNVTQRDEILYGTNASDAIDGRDGNDTLYGNGGTDTLTGGDGNDLIYGADQADLILGGNGDDIVYANGGGDTIDAGTGMDTVWLGNGSATILLNVGEGYTTIKNFQLGATKFKLGSVEGLTYADSSDGVKITKENDLLAVVTWQTTGTISSNTSMIFV
jgi:D-alanyl-D-alanine carboxypeptidase